MPGNLQGLIRIGPADFWCSGTWGKGRVDEIEESPRGHHVCPWWVGYLIASPLRKLGENPDTILAPLVEPGMTTVDIGCAMGFFSLPLARMVGGSGRVVCVDVQERMLAWRERYPGVEELNVAVMGCVVNGPGESRQADIGISLPGTGEAPVAPVFVDGQRESLLSGDAIAEEFITSDHWRGFGVTKAKALADLRENLQGGLTRHEKAMAEVSREWFDGAWRNAEADE